jgi:hypothetical protein
VAPLSQRPGEGHRWQEVASPTGKAEQGTHSTIMGTVGPKLALSADLYRGTAPTTTGRLPKWSPVGPYGRLLAGEASPGSRRW